MDFRQYLTGAFIILCMGLAGCTNSDPQHISNTDSASGSINLADTREYINTVYNYRITIPEIAYRRKKSSTGAHIGFGTIPFLEKPKMDDFEISIDAVNSACSSSLTGASQLLEFPNMSERTAWGKVDYFEKFSGGDFPADFADLCRPHVSGSAYVLCSEKDNKTVVICIDQMTDSPEMAKQIFETFRWTE